MHSLRKATQSQSEATAGAAMNRYKFHESLLAGGILFLLLAAGLAYLFAGCSKPHAQESERPQQIKLIAYEGNSEDAWEIWEDTQTHNRIVCHHSGYTGNAGGRSTSCVLERMP